MYFRGEITLHVAQMVNTEQLQHYIAYKHGFSPVKPCMSHSPLIMIYYALFHSITMYGSIFWGNSSHSQKL